MSTATGTRDAADAARDVRTVRLASRPSPLALAQTGLVARALAAAAPFPGLVTEIVVTRTTGDVDRRDLTEIGGTGVFVGAVRRAVLDGRADVAVHSAKDLPVGPADGLVLAALPARGDVGDVLVLRTPPAGASRTPGTAAGGLFDGLADGARIGTGSPRRAAALAAAARAAGVTVEVVAVRGNVDSRLALVAGGRFDAVVVAAAGLARLGRTGAGDTVPDGTADPDGTGGTGDTATGALTFRRCPLELMLPAPAQGALALECRTDAPEWLRSALAACSDEDTRGAVAAERAVLGALDAGCSTPVGALARRSGPGALHLLVSLAAPDGHLVHAEVDGPAADPDALGTAAAGLLLEQLARSAPPGRADQTDRPTRPVRSDPPAQHAGSDPEGGAS